MPRLGMRRMRGRYRGRRVEDPGRFHGGSLRSRGRRNRCSNPQLMIVNPNMTKGDAEKAFRKFHHVKATRSSKVKLPEGFPKYLTQLGVLDELRLWSVYSNVPGSLHVESGRGKKKAYIATDPEMKTLYIGPLGRSDIRRIKEEGFHAPTRIAYTTPVKSKGVGRRWYHEFDEPPYVDVVENWIVLSGPGLRITDRGIEG